MSYLSINDVPLKYRMKLTGEYNALIIWCKFCKTNEGVLKSIDMVDANYLGFSEWYGDLVVIQECPECFEKQYHHVKSKDMLETIIRLIELQEDLKNRK